MKFKDRYKPVCSSDFYYDLFDGGYINPRELLADEEDIERVLEAIRVIHTFLSEAEDNFVLEQM